MNAWFHEARIAARSMLRSPAFTLVCTGMLGLGLGLCLFMFGAIQSFLLRAPPFPEADRLVAIEGVDIETGDTSMEYSVHDYLDMRREQTSFESLETWYSGTVNLRGDERPERYNGTFATAGLFDTLRVRPILGSTFPRSAETDAGNAQVLISHTLWQNRYGGAMDVIGRAVRVNGRPGTIVGVMPQDFAFPTNVSVWVPLDTDVADVPRAEGIRGDIVGRLRDGVDMEAAKAEMAALHQTLRERHPETVEADRITVMPMADEFIGDMTRRILGTMFAAVVLVLLIACANVANLMLARAASRTHDTAVRSALGASRGTLMVRVLAETLVVALLGAAIGLGLAQIGGEMVMASLRSSEDPPPYWMTEMSIDATTVAMTVGLALLATLAAGLLPAWRIGRTSANKVLREGAAGAVGGGKLGRGLVTAEIALSVTLIATAGMTIRSVLNTADADLGVETRGLITGRVGLFDTSYPDDDALRAFYRDAESALAQLPGADGAAIASTLPLTYSSSNYVRRDDATDLARDALPVAYEVGVSSGYFDTLGVPVLRGRGIDARDRADSQPVVVVSRQLAERLWPGEDPVGRQVMLGDPRTSEDPARVVVGVAGEVLQDNESFEAKRLRERPSMYVPLEQRPARFVGVAVRTAGDPQALARPLADAIASVDADLPVYWLRPLDDWIRIANYDHRLLATLFGLFGAFAMLLAAAGIYATLAYAVSQRTREIGVRRALGASDRSIVRMVARQGGVQMAVGVVIGALLAIVFGTLLANILVDVGSFDPPSLLATLAVFALAVAVASLLPARRAIRVQPIEALRYE